MNILKKLFSIFKSKKKREAKVPSLTILLAINPTREKPEIAKRFLEAQAKKLAFLNPKTVLIDTIKSKDDYQILCKTQLSKYFDTDYVLIIQFDGKIINEAAWSNEFLQYDYIGAPWKTSYEGMRKRVEALGFDPDDENNYVGNGGFCIRSKKLCEYVEAHSDPTIAMNEDTYICQVMRKDLQNAGFTFAPYEVAKRFSVELDEYTGQFGAHNLVVKDGKRTLVKNIK